ncbi:LysR family transcriptional regulator [Pigmentiphaga sp. H8]|uniref:LysR substrate-binding domain-containing protein n=1 Tax=unclassified Pigmentiphaga TaxID=2626614 RepID=UPI000F5A93BE|nr:LysR substrate-binding domain-containing protein [Pigmentiphaga sp. H8]AZG06755.1 LysR family transcriptional regulator [Pigmentiphaga sp. H8]
MKYSLGRHLPSTINLIALVTVARTGNVTRAAQELFLTQSAVSRQIKDLEEFVGRALFKRNRGELSLTPEGRRYVEQIEALLNQIEEATLGLSTSTDTNAHVTVSSQATLAVKWLLPRLADFGKQHPDIIIDVETHVGQIDMKRVHADMLIIFREHAEPGWTLDRLASGGGYPVCAPSLLETTDKRGIAALAVLPLLHQRSSTGGWVEYFESLAQPDLRARPGPTYSLLTMGLQAALAGMGIAILPDFVVQEDLNAGRLVKVHDVPLVKRGSYVLMIKEYARGAPAIERLREWLLAATAL